MENFDEDLALKIERFGRDVERFFSQPIGQYIVKKAQAQANKAIEDLKTVDVHDVVAVRKIQNDLNIPDKIIDWLSVAVEEGRVCQVKRETEPGDMGDYI